MKKVATMILVMTMITSQIAFSTEPIYKESTIELNKLAPFALVSEKLYDTYGANKVTGAVGENDDDVTRGTILGVHDGINVADEKTVSDALNEGSKVMDKVLALKPNFTITGGSSNKTFAPGYYASEGEVVLSENIRLDADGDSDAIFIFSVNRLLGRENLKVELINDAKAENVYWFVKSDTKIERKSTFLGTVIGVKDIEVEEDTEMVGRLVSLDGKVILKNTKLTVPEYVIKSKVEPKKYDLSIKLTIDDKKALVNGSEKTLDVAPFIKDGRTYVPVGFVVNELGGKATFVRVKTERASKIILEQGETKMTLTMGSRQVLVERGDTKKTVVSDSVPLMIDDRTMIPFKVLAENLDATVSFGMKEDNSGVSWVKFEQ